MLSRLFSNYLKIIKIKDRRLFLAVVNFQYEIQHNLRSLIFIF